MTLPAALLSLLLGASAIAAAADGGDLLGDPAPVAIATAPPAAKPALPPRPDEAARHEALARFKKAYGTDLARREPRERLRLARRLLKEAPAQRPDAALYDCMLCEAIRAAADGEDLRLVLDGIDAMTASFDGWDAAAEKRQALRKLYRRPAAAAIVKLLDTPDDARANAVAGKWYAFAAERWAEALPLLARSGEPALVAMAQMEVARPATVAEQLQVADAWADLGRKSPAGDDRNGALARAVHWYRQAAAAAGDEDAAKAKAAVALILPQLPLDLAKVDWNALSAQDWERIQAPVVTVQAKLDRSETQITLLDRQSVRIVAHPTDTWTFGVASLPKKVVCTWQGQPTSVVLRSTNNGGQGGNRSVRARTVVLGLDGMPYGSLLMWLNPNEKQAAGIIAGPGKLWLGPSSDRTDESEVTGAIRVKIVPVDDAD